MSVKPGTKVEPKRSLSAASKKPKESAVLSDGSLAILAREISLDKLNGLVLCMYLNIPNTTIVQASNDATPRGLIDATDTAKIETTQKLLLLWKQLRVGKKEKDKVKELETALREMGKAEIADIIHDKDANNVELSSEALSSA